MRQGYRLGDQVLRHALVGGVVDTVDDGSAAPQKADTPVNGDQSGAQNAESN